MGRREEIIELLEKALAERGHPALWSNEEHETLAEGIGWLMSLDEVDGQVRMLHVSRPHQLIHEVFESVGHNKGWDAGSGTRILPIGKP